MEKNFFSSFVFYILVFFAGAILAGGCVFFYSNSISDKTVENLRGRLAEFDRNITALKNNNEQLERTKNNLTAVNQGLTDSIRERDGTISGLEESIRNRQKVIDGIGKAVGNIGSGIDSATDDISKLEIYLRRITTAISNITNIISASKNAN